MEDYETPDLEFVKGFNEGYMLAQHAPELAAQLRELPFEGARSDGFRAGQQEVQLERERQQERAKAPDWLRADFLDTPPEVSERDRSRDRELER